MVRQCPHCRKIQQSLDNYTCEFCEKELIDNGQLIEALTFWDIKKTASITQNLIPLGLITASGIASAALNTYLILFVGIAAAAIYYLKQNKYRNHR
jgi:hypothetical protein